MRPLIVTGTDTDVGKTVVAAMLTLGLNALYWKPIQAGTADGTDTARVAAMTGLPPERLLPEAYVLSEPLSPHRAAELDHVTIDVDRLQPPRAAEGRFLVVEGAGGVLVPITRALVQADLFARWGAPVVVVARTALGTINHTLLTLEALARRNIAVLGIVFNGTEMPDTERTILDFSGAKRLGCIPPLSALDAAHLRAAFANHFDRRDFEALRDA